MGDFDVDWNAQSMVQVLNNWLGKEEVVVVQCMDSLARIEDLVRLEEVSFHVSNMAGFEPQMTGGIYVLSLFQIAASSCLWELASYLADFKQDHAESE